MLVGVAENPVIIFENEPVGDDMEHAEDPVVFDDHYVFISLNQSIKMKRKR